MVVVATHQIAIVLYNLDLDLGGHKKDLVTWMAPPDDKVFRGIYPDGIIPTLFMNKRYRDFEQYPNGVADIVGYWAEAQIFGGVVLFDRRKPCDREPYEDVGHPFLVLHWAPFRSLCLTLFQGLVQIGPSPNGTN